MDSFNLQQHIDTLESEYLRKVQGFNYKGLLLHKQLTNTRFLDKLPDFNIRSDDVLVASYPKSGTTWTEEIVCLVNHNGRKEKVLKKPLHMRALHLECGAPTIHETMLKFSKSPRTLATHLTYNLLPNQVKQGKCKVVYVSRNPKDTAISYYYHHRMANFLGNYKMEWDDFFEMFIRGKLVYGCWFDHVLSYWTKSVEKNILFIKYEDMKKDLFQVVSTIATFLGKNLSPEVIQSIVDHCTFENMKNNAMCNRERLPKPFKVFDMSETKFMRKGIVGDWKNHFKDEQNERFKLLYNRKMPPQLKFDFEGTSSTSNNDTQTNGFDENEKYFETPFVDSEYCASSRPNHELNNVRTTSGHLNSHSSIVKV